MKMRTSDLECIGDRLHREASFGYDKSRKLGFFDSDFARASRKISTSIVLRPSAGLEARLDDLQLLLGRPMPPANRAGDQFDTLVVVRHKPVLEDSLKPSRLCRVSGRNGGQFTSFGLSEYRAEASHIWLAFCKYSFHVHSAVGNLPPW